MTSHAVVPRMMASWAEKVMSDTRIEAVEYVPFNAASARYD